MEYESPILESHTPFFFDVHDGKINGLFRCLIVWELHFGLSIFSDTPVEVFNRVGGVNDLTYLQWKIKIAGQVFPVGLPGLDGMTILSFPLRTKPFKCLSCCCFAGRCIDFLQIGTKCLAVFPYYIFAGIANLVYHAKLGNSIGENTMDGISKTF